MILGAGVYQVPLIKKATELGIYTIVVSIPGDYPGFKFADKVYYENTTDTERILQIAQQEKIDGITTCRTDVALVTLATVCEKLNLRGLPLLSAQRSCNKILMKKALYDAHVNVARFHICSLSDSLDSVKEICRDINYPVMVKAIDSSGSRGITIVENESQVEYALANVKSVTHKGEFLIEEFLIGEEFGADAYIQNGEIEFIIPHGKYVYKANTGIPIGHYAPYGDDAISEKTIHLMEQSIKAMGFNNCAVNADIMLCKGVPYIIEIGGRAGATCLPELISINNGYNYYEKLIKACLSSTESLKPIKKEKKASASKLIYSTKSGKITSIQGLEFINENSKTSAGVYTFVLDKSTGDTVNAFKIGPDRFGHIVAYSDTVKKAEDILDNTLSILNIEVN